MFLLIGIFLMSFIVAGITSKAVENGSGQNGKNDNGKQNQIQSDVNTENQGDKIKNITTEKNRIRERIEREECPFNCTCTGSVTKCWLADGTREMTVIAGKSGNMIVQVKGINASTNVILYKSEDGKVYGVFRNNETKRIKLLPDQAREKIRERLARQLEDEDITLNESGNYEYRAHKRARLFFIFPVRLKVQAELDSETGKIIQVRNPWWGFLAKDEEAEPILGASCGTVTPGMNDECCQNKGYDIWNAESGECRFSTEG